MGDNKWIGEAFELFLAVPELRPMLVGFLQIVGIAVGTFVLRRCHNRDMSWVYVVCLGGVIAVNLVLPLHLARVGWSYPIPTFEQSTSIAVDQLPASLLDSGISQPTLNPFSTQIKTFSEGELERSFDDTLITSNIVKSSITMQSTIPLSAWPIAIAIYASVVLFQLLRTARGWQLLQQAARRGITLSDRSSRLIQDCQHRLRISSQVTVFRSTEVSLPLTFGFIRPVVLLPVDFEEWTPLEQRAVVMHEFSHIARRDMLGELLVRSMQAFYWLHPASHWIANQVRAVREGATDQRVIASGFSPQEYAMCLVQILERELASSTKCLPRSPSIAMSAYGDMEVRINSILRGEEKMDCVRGSVWIVCLALFMSVTMVRLDAVPTANPISVLIEAPTMPTETPLPEASPNQARSSTLVTDDLKRLPNNDLLDMILKGPVAETVANNIDSPDGVLLNLSGRVLGPNGKPVRGCTVVLRHIDEGKLYKLLVKSTMEFPSLSVDTRLQSLRARTTTDDNGRYSFSNLFVPSDLDPVDHRAWTGQLIAGHSKMGIGWENFASVREQNISRELDIRLSEVTSVEGQCLNSDGTSAGETHVVVSGMSNVAESRSHYILLLGDLQVDALTDSNGRFQFLNFPKNAVVNISATGVGCRGGTFLRVAKDHVNSSDFESIDIPRGLAIQTNPALLNLRKAVQIPIRVINTKGEPVSGVEIYGVGPRQKTDHLGLIHLTIYPQDAEAANTFDTAANRESRIFASFEKGSPYLSTSHTFRWDSITESKPIDFVVEEGTRVRGRVITKEGSGAPGAVIREVKPSGQSSKVDDEGNFELTLPKQKCRLILCGLGYRIPSFDQVSRFNSALEFPSDWRCFEVDATKGDAIELPTITVQKSEPIHVVAQLPNGIPANSATAILTDINIVREDQNLYFRKGFLSTSVSIGSDGFGTLLPQGIPSKLASVEVRLIHENTPYLGIAKLDQMSGGQLSVRLKPEWLIRGRISLDGQPVQGAWVHAKRDMPTNGETLRPDSVLLCSMTTNPLGEYEFIVPRDRDYEIQVSSLPQDNSAYGSTHKLTQRTANEMEVPEFRFEKGTESISGTVVNLKGEPIADAFVSIRGEKDRLWIGHFASSPVKTDKSGRFVSRSLPKGTLHLRASWSEVPKRTASSSAVAISTGETNVRLIVPTNQTNN